MAKFCHEMHYILPISVICVAHSALWPLLLHHKPTVIIDMVMVLEMILISSKRGCSIAVGS
jgi:hypothetical protein